MLGTTIPKQRQIRKTGSKYELNIVCIYNIME